MNIRVGHVRPLAKFSYEVEKEKFCEYKVTIAIIPRMIIIIAIAIMIMVIDIIVIVIILFQSSNADMFV